MPTMQGKGGQAVPDTKGVPVPKVAHRTTPKRHEPPNRGWARRPSPEEFTAKQLRDAGYHVGVTKAKTTTTPVRRVPGETYDAAAVVRDYLAGDSSHVVAVRHRVSARTVLTLVRRAGGRVRSRGEQA